MSWLRRAFEKATSALATWKQAKKALTEARAHEKVSEVLHQIQNEKWAEVHQQFIPILRWYLNEAELRKGLKTVRMVSGPVEKVGTPVVTTGWFTTAKVPIHFKRSKVALLLRMTGSGKLVGLNFLSKRLAGFGTPWQPPPYADENSFREVDIVLGSERYKVGGTLSLPKVTGQYPCIVLISGSGPCDRDSTVEAAKPFKDLAWGLATRGVAVLRFDKAAFTHGKKLRGRKNITLTDEYMDHVLDAVRQSHQHPEIDQERTFVLGHSLGACVAPRVATMEPSIAGCVIMAGPAGPIYRSALRQLRYLASLDGFSGPSLDANMKGTSIEDLRCQAEIADSPELSLSTPASKLPFGLGPSYWLDMRTFDPIGTTQRLEKPILVLQGGRDYQVTMEDDYSKWFSSLKDRKNVEFRVYEKLNHLFISGEGPPTPLEYDTPGNVDDLVIRDISAWIFRKSGKEFERSE